MDPSLNDYLSDDEIFFGKMTLKEVKKRIFMDKKHRQMLSHFSDVKDNQEDSLTLIETHSEPNTIVIKNSNDSHLKSISTPELPCNTAVRDSNISADDTFIRLERIVSDLCLSPHDNVNQPLDNTLDVVDFILNNADVKEHMTNEGLSEPPIEDSIKEFIEKKNNVLNIESLVNIDNEHVKDIPKVKTDINQTTPYQSIKNLQIINDLNVESKEFERNTNDLNLGCKQTLKSELKQIPKLINTPKCNKNYILKIKENNVFKTPKTPCSSQKTMSTKKTPNRTNNYQHITSPIASYIKNCPQIPLVKDVLPRKPLPGTSCIPKLSKPSTEIMSGNKENVQLPSIAYKSAKETKMVIAASQKKMPTGEWPNKLTNSLKKPVVIKHDHRVINSIKHLSKRQEDSFGDLTLQQADLSVCTKKSAFVKEI